MEPDHLEGRAVIDYTEEMAEEAPMRSKIGQSLKSGSTRIQVRDPLDPRKILSITAPTPGEAAAKAEAVRSMRRDLQLQLITPEEVARRLAILRGGAAAVVPRMKTAWIEYVGLFGPERQRALDGTWDLHFRAHFGDLSVLEVTPELWKAWEKEKAAACSKGYIKTLHAYMRSAVNKLVEAGKIGSFPWSKWRPSGRIGKDVRKREPLRSIEEVERLLTAAREHDERLRGWGMYSDAYIKVAMLALAGLRQGEAAALGWDHIRAHDTREGQYVTAFIEYQSKAHWRRDFPQWERPRYPPKCGSVRTLRLHGTLRDAVWDHRAYLIAHNLYRPDGPVFPVPPGKGQSAAGAIWRSDEWIIKPELVRNFAGIAGLELDLSRFCPHALRHTFVTLELAATSNPVATAQRSGHKDLSVFFQYAASVGRGLPDSPLPAVRVGPPRIAHLVPTEALPAAPVEEITEERAAEIEALRAGARELVSLVGPQDSEDRYLARLSEFERAFRGWDAAGRRGERPREVTERANEAYSRAYNAAMRSSRRGQVSEDRAKKDAANAGFRAKRAVLGAWGRLLARLDPVPAAGAQVISLAERRR